MATCVEISVDDSGAVSVGLTDGPSESGQTQPAKSIGDALAMARHLLTQPQSSDQTSAGTPDGQGGGTGPDAGGTTVSSVQGSATDPDGDGDNDTTAGGDTDGDAKALWDQLAQMKLPQN